MLASQEQLYSLSLLIIAGSLNFNVISSPHFAYIVPQNSVNLKHSTVLAGMFRFKPASQFVELYHSVVGCVLNREDLILKTFYKFSK
jgi:hypothetical protein